MKKEVALDILYDAIKSYCEDCISTDTDEQELVQEAYSLVEEIVKKAKEDQHATI